MPRSAAYSDTTLARVRRHYGLSQHELAALLGITPALASQLESGRRALSPAVAARLAPFAAHLPPAAEASARHLAEVQAEAAGELPPPPPGPVEAGPLERRRAACLHEARTLRGRLRHLPAQAAVAARWAAAMPALLAALPPAPPATEATPEAVRLRYVHAWLATVPLAPDAGQLAAWHLGYARAQALEAEAAALTVILGN